MDTITLTDVYDGVVATYKVTLPDGYHFIENSTAYVYKCSIVAPNGEIIEHLYKSYTHGMINYIVIGKDNVMHMCKTRTIEHHREDIVVIDY